MLLTIALSPFKDIIHGTGAMAPEDIPVVADADYVEGVRVIFAFPWATVWICVACNVAFGSTITDYFNRSPQPAETD